MKDFILVHERFWRSTLAKHSSDTRICFLALLQLADKEGFVDETLSTVSDFASLPIESTQGAIFALEQPDPHSRTEDFDGRRLIPGPDGAGWVVVNYRLYREKIAALKQGEARREYMKQYMRARRRQALTPVNSVNFVKPVKERRGERKEREEGTKTPSLPPELDSPRFRSTWKDWEAHRKEIRHPLKSTTRAKQLSKLATYGESGAIERLERSMANGWTGFDFDPDKGSSATKGRRPLETDDTRRDQIAALEQSD